MRFPLVSPERAEPPARRHRQSSPSPARCVRSRCGSASRCAMIAPLEIQNTGTAFRNRLCEYLHAAGALLPRSNLPTNLGGASRGPSAAPTLSGIRQVVGAGGIERCAGKGVDCAAPLVASLAALWLHSRRGSFVKDSDFLNGLSRMLLRSVEEESEQARIGQAFGYETPPFIPPCACLRGRRAGRSGGSTSGADPLHWKAPEIATRRGERESTQAAPSERARGH